MASDILTPPRAEAPSRGVVLVAASEGDLAPALQAPLDDNGFGLGQVRTVEELAEVVRRETLAAVLLDSALLDQHGSNWLVSLLAATPDRPPRVILLVDRERSDTLETLVAEGVDDFLLKPVDPIHLLARLRIAERSANDQARLRESHQRMRAELLAAARVQQALLPPAAYRVPGYDVAWALRPCDELAGDILNVLRVDEHHLAFYVLDVSGHGVSAALLSCQISRLMSPVLSESDLLKARLPEAPWYRVVEPAEVLKRLNELFPMSERLAQYFTMTYGLIHLESGHVRYSVAGHPAPIFGHAATARARRCRGNPVGLVPNPTFGTEEFTMESGDSLWLISDGLIEARRSDDELHGTSRLCQSIERFLDRPVAESVERVMGSVQDWCKPEDPDDDCTLLAIRRA